jgi:hypothetical protein
LDRNELDGKTGLEHLIYLAEAEPQFFKKDIPTILLFIDRVFSHTYEDLAIENQTLEFMAVLLEHTTDILTEYPEAVKSLIEKTVKMMIKVDSEVEDTWYKPHEGFQDVEDETIDIDYVKLGKKLIIRYLTNVEDKGAVPYLFQLLS